MKWVSNLGPNTCVEDFKFPPHEHKLCGGQRFAQSTFHRHVPQYCATLVLSAPFQAAETGIGQHRCLTTMQQGMHLHDIRDVPDVPMSVWTKQDAA